MTKITLYTNNDKLIVFKSDIEYTEWAYETVLNGILNLDIPLETKKEALVIVNMAKIRRLLNFIEYK